MTSDQKDPYRNRRAVLWIGLAVASVVVVALWGIQGARAPNPVVMAAKPDSVPTAPAPSRAPTSSGDLPPADAPWRDVREALVARIKAGDKAASIRLFGDLVHCEEYLSAKQQAEAELGSEKGGISAAERADRDAMLQRFSSILRAYEKSCSNVSGEELSSDAYRILLDAADAGSNAAASCFVSAYYDMGSATQTPEGIEHYRTNALRLAQSGLERGDWAMVYVMARAYGSRRRAGAFGQLVEPDPEKAYAYARLMQLGAEGQLVEHATSRTEDILRANTLSPDAIKASDAWAQAMYSKYFNGSKLSELPSPCSPP